MLSFQQQQKIVNEILKRPSNQQCADCNTISPTWASLDFGVFLCSNCSGAHRALGPTITRVKSTKLDKWESDWFSNMQIGNKEINQFWQHKVTALTKKPKLGASLDDVNRYVIDKYMKRKYAAEGEHPLKLYKQNKYMPGKNKLTVPNSIQSVKSEESKTKNTNSVKNEVPIPVKKNIGNLLQFEQQIHKPRSDGNPFDQRKAVQEEEEFGVYTDAATDNSKQLTFEQLMNKEKSKTNQKVHQSMQNGINSQFGSVHGHMNNGNQFMMNNGYMQNNVHMQSMNQYNQHINPRNNGMYHSLSHNEVGQPGQYPWMNHIHQYHHQNTMGIQGSLPVNAKYPGDFTPISVHGHQTNGQHSWMNHHHHYHQQNTVGIQGSLPVNAKYPGQFTPITLQTTHSQKKVVDQTSWADSWK